MYQTNMPIYSNSSALNSPTTTKFSMEQQYANMQNQLQQYQNPQQKQIYSDPYTDYIEVIRSCSKLVQEQIYNDPSYIKAEDNWENLKRQALNEIIVPQLLQTNQGYSKCEALYQTALKCKEFYEQAEVEATQKLIQTQQQLQNFYDNPEALKKRLLEIEQSKQAQQNPVEENTKQNNNKNKYNSGGNN